MLAPSLPVRASGFVRALAVAVLLVGIAAMHMGLFSMDSRMDQRPAGSAEFTAMSVTDHPLGASAADHHPMTAHGGMHACVFILSAAVLAVGLVLLFRAAGPFDDAPMPVSGLWRRHRERPPPWTTPSLAELSILRI
ncbi:DUF6153 family protein [Nocardia tengchongensis]